MGITSSSTAKAESNKTEHDLHHQVQLAFVDTKKPLVPFSCKQPQ
jgi:hypothetical protein